MGSKDSMPIGECHACGNTFLGEEKLCPVCGAELIQSEIILDPDFILEGFEPETEVMECIYGPPPCDCKEEIIKENGNLIQYGECRACGMSFFDGEKFCSICGAELTQTESVFNNDFEIEEFKPDDNIMGCIYGPPPCDYSFKCNSCGNIWTESLMYLQKADTCPKCGSHDICNCEDAGIIYVEGEDTVEFDIDSLEL